MPRVVLTREADADLTDVWNYIAQDNSVRADKVANDINDMVQRLAAQPDLGIPQFQYRENLRCKPVRKRYLIFYEPIEDGICVLRVLHAARNWDRLF